MSILSFGEALGILGISLSSLNMASSSLLVAAKLKRGELVAKVNLVPHNHHHRTSFLKKVDNFYLSNNQSRSTHVRHLCPNRDQNMSLISIFNCITQSIEPNRFGFLQPCFTLPSLAL